MGAGQEIGLEAEGVAGTCGSAPSQGRPVWFPFQESVKISLQLALYPTSLSYLHEPLLIFMGVGHDREEKRVKAKLQKTGQWAKSS